MTNFRQVADYSTKIQRQEDEDQMLAAGFLYQWIRNAPRWTYTWRGNFPVFEVTPGHLGAGTGLVARYLKADIEILFAYETPPGDIATRLDDEILALMRHDAEIADQPPVDEGDDWLYF